MQLDYPGFFYLPLFFPVESSTRLSRFPFLLIVWPLSGTRLPLLLRYGLDTDPHQTEAFGWLCNSTVVRLPGPEKGCLVYSPVLGPDNTLSRVVSELEGAGLLPVRVIVAPSPQHHMALAQVCDAR